MTGLNQSDYSIYIFQLMLKAYRFPCITSKNYCEETVFPLSMASSEVSLYSHLVQITPTMTAVIGSKLTSQGQ